MKDIGIMTSALELVVVAVVAFVGACAVAAFTIKRLIQNIVDGYTIFGIILLVMIAAELAFIVLILDNSIII